MDCFTKKVSVVSEDSIIYTKGLREIDSLINKIKGLRLLSSLILIGPSGWIFLVTDSVHRKMLVLGWITSCSSDSEVLTIVGCAVIGCSN
jgi:hypothetical protein